MTTSLALDGLGFPEALRWRGDELWFSDMFRGRVLRWIPGSRPVEALGPASGCPEIPGGIGWLPDGELLVVDTTGRRVLRSGPRGVEVHADLSHRMSRPANDMHVDPDGVAWVGGYGFDPESEAPRESSLVRVAADGTMSATTATLTFPNGCERDPSGRLVVAETFADRITVLTPDAASPLAHVDLATGDGPDGLSIAPDGAVFVALAFRGAVLRLTPETREVVTTSAPIEGGPGEGPTGCYDCAVHPSGRLLAVASASLDEDLAQRVDTGRITLIPLNAPGES